MAHHQDPGRLDQQTYTLRSPKRLESREWYSGKPALTDDSFAAEAPLLICVEFDREEEVKKNLQVWMQAFCNALCDL